MRVQVLHLFGKYYLVVVKEDNENPMREKIGVSRRRVDWSYLFPELLSMIAGNLHSRNDIVRFRSVCRNWRSVVPEPPQNLPNLSHLFPHKLSAVPPPLLNSTDFSEYVYRGWSLILVANTTYLIKPTNKHSKDSKPWLITVEEVIPGKFCVRRPLTRDILKDFGQKFFQVLGLYGFDVLEVCKGYNFRWDAKQNYDLDRSCVRSINKQVVFFDPNCKSPSIDDCIVVVLYDDGILAFVRLRDESWGCIQYRRVSRFDDVVNYNGKVYALDRRARVYVIQYGLMRIDVIVNVPLRTGYQGVTRKRLVESSGELYLIERVYNAAIELKFNIYKLNEGVCKWEEVESLDGRVLFVCTDYCFFAEARDFPGCRGDCIFFPIYHFPGYEGSLYPDDFFFDKTSEDPLVGVFHLGTGSGLISAFHGYSNFLWPPPRWLYQIGPNLARLRWEKGETKAQELLELKLG